MPWCSGSKQTAQQRLKVLQQTSTPTINPDSFGHTVISQSSLRCLMFPVQAKSVDTDYKESADLHIWHGSPAGSVMPGVRNHLKASPSHQYVALFIPWLTVKCSHTTRFVQFYCTSPPRHSCGSICKHAI